MGKVAEESRPAATTRPLKGAAVKSKRRKRKRDLEELHRNVIETRKNLENKTQGIDGKTGLKKGPIKICGRLLPKSLGIYKNGATGKEARNTNLLLNESSKARIRGDIFKLLKGDESKSKEDSEDESLGEILDKALAGQAGDSKATAGDVKCSPILAKKQSRQRKLFTEEDQDRDILQRLNLKQDDKKNVESETELPKTFNTEKTCKRRLFQNKERNDSNKKRVNEDEIDDTQTSSQYVKENEENEKNTSGVINFKNLCWSPITRYEELCTKIVKENYENGEDFLEGFSSDPLLKIKEKLRQTYKNMFHQYFLRENARNGTNEDKDNNFRLPDALFSSHDIPCSSTEVQACSPTKDSESFSALENPNLVSVKSASDLEELSRNKKRFENTPEKINDGKNQRPPTWLPSDLFLHQALVNNVSNVTLSASITRNREIYTNVQDLNHSVSSSKENHLKPNYTFNRIEEVNEIASVVTDKDHVMHRFLKDVTKSKNSEEYHFPNNESSDLSEERSIKLKKRFLIPLSVFQSVENSKEDSKQFRKELIKQDTRNFKHIPAILRRNVGLLDRGNRSEEFHDEVNPPSERYETFSKLHLPKNIIPDLKNPEALKKSEYKDFSQRFAGNPQFKFTRDIIDSKDSLNPFLNSILTPIRMQKYRTSDNMSSDVYRYAPLVKNISAQSMAGSDNVVGEATNSARQECSNDRINFEEETSKGSRNPVHFIDQDRSRRNARREDTYDTKLTNFSRHARQTTRGESQHLFEGSPRRVPDEYNIEKRPVVERRSENVRELNGNRELFSYGDKTSRSLPLMSYIAQNDFDRDEPSVTRKKSQTETFGNVTVPTELWHGNPRLPNVRFLRREKPNDEKTFLEVVDERYGGRERARNAVGNGELHFQTSRQHLNSIESTQEEFLPQSVKSQNLQEVRILSDKDLSGVMTNVQNLRLLSFGPDENEMNSGNQKLNSVNSQYHLNDTVFLRHVPQPIQSGIVNNPQNLRIFSYGSNQSHEMKSGSHASNISNDRCDLNDALILQNTSQPVKYIACENGQSVQRIPVYIHKNVDPMEYKCSMKQRCPSPVRLVALKDTAVLQNMPKVVVAQEEKHCRNNNCLKNSNLEKYVPATNMTSTQDIFVRIQDTEKNKRTLTHSRNLACPTEVCFVPVSKTNGPINTNETTVRDSRNLNCERSNINIAQPILNMNPNGFNECVKYVKHMNGNQTILVPQGFSIVDQREIRSSKYNGNERKIRFATTSNCPQNQVYDLTEMYPVNVERVTLDHA